jgi:CheY-like chemotaxis protein
MTIRFEGKTALIVEDDPISLKFLNLLLNKYGFVTLNAESGNEAINIFKNKDIDIVLLDIQIPELNGYEITRICKSLNKNVPIIAQSANDIIGFKEKCEDAGCDDFISKPINREELINKIQKLIC